MNPARELKKIAVELEQATKKADLADKVLYNFADPEAAVRAVDVATEPPWVQWIRSIGFPTPGSGEVLVEWHAGGTDEHRAALDKLFIDLGATGGYG